MKTSEQILEEYARLRPVKCFACGGTHEWEAFEQCIIAYSANDLGMFRCRKFLVDRILPEAESRQFWALTFILSNKLGGVLVDEAHNLSSQLQPLFLKKFCARSLLSFESSKDVLEQLFQFVSFPTISETSSKFVREFHARYKNYYFKDFTLNLSSTHLEWANILIAPKNNTLLFVDDKFGISRLGFKSYLHILMDQKYFYLDKIYFSDKGPVVFIGDGKTKETVLLTSLVDYKKLNMQQVENIMSQLTGDFSKQGVC